MEMDAKTALDRLEHATKAYLHAKGDRSESALTLQRCIDRSEIECANLARTMGDNYEQRKLHQQLVFTVEMAKGTLRQQTAARA
jgi:hypothetical protein